MMSNFSRVSVVGLLLLLAGCGTFRPLYGSGPEGKNVVASLSLISVEEQHTRTGQLLRNELLSNLGSGDDNSYSLKMIISENTSEVSGTPGTVVKRKRYTLIVRYKVVQLSDGKEVTSGTSFAATSFDTLRQPIADLKAADNARDRGTTQVGQDIRQRLAAFLATHES
jgi:hypothetical protein